MAGSAGQGAGGAQQVVAGRGQDARDCLRRTPRSEDYRRITLAYGAEAAELGAVYLEPILDAEERTDGAAGWADILAACCDAAAEVRERFGVEIGWTPQIFRGYDVTMGEEAARVATRFAGRGVVGFGLWGAEGRAETAPHTRAVRIAQEGGLPFVPTPVRLPARSRYARCWRSVRSAGLATGPGS